MANTRVNYPTLRLELPTGEWTEHSTPEQYEFRLSEKEQLIAVVHPALHALAANELQKVVIELFHVRLDTAQKISGNSCVFDSPACTQSSDRFNASVFGRDARQGFRMGFGFFGTPQKIVVMSYYDYTGTRTQHEFKQRASAVLSSVQV